MVCRQHACTGKTVFPVDKWSMEDPMYVAMVTPSIHYTMGGLAIDSQARVQVS